MNIIILLEIWVFTGPGEDIHKLVTNPDLNSNEHDLTICFDLSVFCAIVMLEGE